MNPGDLAAIVSVVLVIGLAVIPAVFLCRAIPPETTPTMKEQQ